MTNIPLESMGIVKLLDGTYLIPSHWSNKHAFSVSIYIKDDIGTIALYEIQKDRNRMYRHYPFIGTSLRHALITPRSEVKIVSSNPPVVHTNGFRIEDEYSARILMLLASEKQMNYATIEQSFIGPNMGQEYRSTLAWVVAALISFGILKIIPPPVRAGSKKDDSGA